MHQSLNELPERVLLDTNVLLDAVFVNGLARVAVALLRQLGFSPIVSDGVWEEAETTLRRLRARLGLQFDPMPFLELHSREFGLLHAPPSGLLQASGVNRADRHVVSTARDRQAWVLTGDSPLVVQCASAGVTARLPWDVIGQHLETVGEQWGLGHIVRNRPLSKETGHLFARVLPGSWAGTQTSGRYVLFDADDLGKVFYSCVSRQWAFELSSGPTVSINADMNYGETWAVSASYQLPREGKEGKIAIHAGQHQAHITSRNLKTFHSLTKSPGPVHLGGSSGVDGWMGHVRSITTGPQTINNETWKALSSIPEGAPNPFDADALSSALLLIQQTGGFRKPTIIERPNEVDLWRYARPAG